MNPQQNEPSQGKNNSGKRNVQLLLPPIILPAKTAKPTADNIKTINSLIARAGVHLSLYGQVFAESLRQWIQKLTEEERDFFYQAATGFTETECLKKLKEIALEANDQMSGKARENALLPPATTGAWKIQLSAHLEIYLAFLKGQPDQIWKNHRKLAQGHQSQEVLQLWDEEIDNLKVWLTEGSTAGDRLLALGRKLPDQKQVSYLSLLKTLLILDSEDKRRAYLEIQP